MIAIARFWGFRLAMSPAILPTPASMPRHPSAPTPGWNVACPKSDGSGFDPTNNALADEQYIRVGVGRDYRDVSPTRGVRHGGGETQLEVEVLVRCLKGSPAS